MVSRWWALHFFVFVMPKQLATSCSCLWLFSHQWPAPLMGASALYFWDLLQFYFSFATVRACYSSREMLQLKCKWSFCLAGIIYRPHNQLGSWLHNPSSSRVCLFAALGCRMASQSVCNFFFLFCMLIPYKFRQFPAYVRLGKNCSRIALHR